jgi:predicted AAA+ superfamily ATPase
MVGSSPYAARIVDAELAELLGGLAALALEGPKGVGKTRTAAEQAGTLHRLDDPESRAILAADPRRLLSGRPPVLIDEWQRLPESWDLVRRAVDDDPTPGRFLLTGSAAPTSTPTHSGAGRIVSVRMRPMSLAERGVGRPTVSLRALLSGRRAPVEGQTDVTLEQYVDEIVRSGYPGLRALPPRALRAQLDGYLDRIVERDFDELGHRVRHPATLRRWMSAYAAATATCASLESVRDAATGGENEKPAKTTTQPYRDILERLYIIDAVPPWMPSRNRLARLTAPPKHHLADPALAARLLGVGAEALLEARPAPGAPRAAVPRDGPLLGQLFESLVTLCVRVYAQAAEARVVHLRTRGGEREIDLLVGRADERVVAVEVKLARTVDDADVRHLHWLREQLGPDLLDAVVVTTGSEAYRRRDGVAVVPAALLGP